MQLAWALPLTFIVPPTGVAVLSALQAVGNAQEGAITLRAGVLEVIEPLHLNPAHQHHLDSQQGACME